MNPTFPPKHLVIFGRPGSGKSSLAERLKTNHGYTLVRTGELLRSSIRKKDSLGAQVESTLASGNLVPDLLVFELLERFLKSPVNDHLLFDGFPRTLGQVPLLDRLERRMGFSVDCYLEIAVGANEALDRMTARRVCPQCGATFHLRHQPPKHNETCDHDGTPLVRRADDSPEVIQVRQQVYDEHTGPVIAHYRDQAPERYRRVNGEQSFDAVLAEIRQVLGFGS